MILIDTSELMQPRQRNLHAAWQELLLTSDLPSIDHIEFNRWTVDHGAEWGIRAEETLRTADLTFLNWIRTPAGLERWIQAGLLACWPSPDNPPAGEVLDSTEDGIRRMTHGDGGKLRLAGQRLFNGLQEHPDPDGLVERTRGLLPNATVESDRRHPTYPHRPNRTKLAERQPGGSGPAAERPGTDTVEWTCLAGIREETVDRYGRRTFPGERRQALGATRRG